MIFKRVEIENLPKEILFNDIFEMLMYFKNIIKNDERTTIYTVSCYHNFVKMTISGVTFYAKKELILQFNSIFNHSLSKFEIDKSTEFIFNWTKNNLNRIDGLINLKSFI